MSLDRAWDRALAARPPHTYLRLEGPFLDARKGGHEYRVWVLDKRGGFLAHVATGTGATPEEALVALVERLGENAA